MKLNPITVDLEYPRVEGNKNAVQIDLTCVRASDGLMITYDYERDGWSIKQPKMTHPKLSDGTYGYHEEWIETAFVQSWPFGDPEFIEKPEGK